MSGIQTFKYKRKNLTVIFWYSKVWFDAKEIRNILGYKKDLHRFRGLLREEERFFRLGVQLISENGLYILTYHKCLTPKQREKAQELFDFVQAEIMPVFNEYIRSWL